MEIRVKKSHVLFSKTEFVSWLSITEIFFQNKILSWEIWGAEAQSSACNGKVSSRIFQQKSLKQNFQFVKNIVER